jgi:parvulin-like peptidyl-prolyl isomerase
VKSSSFGIVLACLCLLSVAAQAQETRPAEPTSQPADKVLATVGEEKIVVSDVDRAFIRQMNQYLEQMPGGIVPPERLAELWQRMFEQAVNSKLIAAYLKSVPVPAEELAARKQKITDDAKLQYGLDLPRFMAALGVSEEDLANEVKLDKLLGQAAGQEKVDAVVAAFPERFDGTTVQASHILVKCSPNESAEKKEVARKKLLDLAEQIKAGKITFEDAAKANSDCPSKAQGGDLGPFIFKQMATEFSEAAFSMKVGELSGVVQSPFGMHLIKVTARTPGSGKPGEEAAEAAADMLRYQLQQRMLGDARKTTPVVMMP